jgi:hypothetical protein
MRTTKWTAAIAALVLIAGACGGDDEPAADEPAADEPAADEPDEPARTAADEPAGSWMARCECSSTRTRRWSSGWRASTSSSKPTIRVSPSTCRS